jgi:hypothetical protein
MKILQTSNMIWRVISPFDKKVWRYQSGNQKSLIEKKNSNRKMKNRNNDPQNAKYREK